MCQAIYSPDVIISFRECSCGGYYYYSTIDEESVFRNTESVTSSSQQKLHVLQKEQFSKLLTSGPGEGPLH